MNDISTTAKAIVPEYLLKDRFWKGTLYLFSQHPKLKQVFTTSYFNFEEGTVDGKQLQVTAKAWSSSEKAILNLALHLYNERFDFSLSDLDYLDYENKELL